MKWEPRKLEEVMKEVEEIERKEKRPIDPKIRDLVIGLRRWGINTKFSCQGHEKLLPFPWVIISAEDVGKFHVLSGLFNLQNRPMLERIHWGTIAYTWPSGEIDIRVLPIKMSSNKNPFLEEIQEHATEFGKFLKELPELPNFLKKT